MKAKNCMIDWLEFSVYGLPDIEKAIQHVTQIMDITDFIYENRQNGRYKEMKVFDNCIYICRGLKGQLKTGLDLAKEHEDNHIHVIITGKGCRILENKYNSKDIRFEILARFAFPVSIELKVSRMDICVDFDEKFVLDYYMDTHYKRLNGVRSAAPAGELGKGITLYLGSRKSEKYFRVYEKDHQTGDFVNYKDRVELVLKGQYASNELVNENDLYKIISTYMSEITWYSEVLQEGWKSMQGQLCEISPKIRHRKTTAEEKFENVLKQYGGRMKTMAELKGLEYVMKKMFDLKMSQSDIRNLHNAKVIRMINAKKRAVKQVVAQNETYIKLKADEMYQMVSELRETHIRLRPNEFYQMRLENPEQLAL